ncbi:hypothetical protein E2C01_015424 [Portunus trituberculatus]|uniref:Uncharacterized protein n=1 Tax=Portunus trituberculatus TaxID=210409 RepID=A0A5B7DLH1_PORTR|nr:hypothetical protein [Portunus trituberculatus]
MKSSSFRSGVTVMFRRSSSPVVKGKLESSSLASRFINGCPSLAALRCAFFCSLSPGTWSGVAFMATLSVSHLELVSLMGAPGLNPRRTLLNLLR